tara:strand:+ start:622 stop:1509 length:888 start_codon:yes stop_codon:yes gene_type:complete
MKAIHQNDYCAIGNQHEHVTSRINDMLIELQNHAYQTGAERGKQQVIEANAAAGEIPPTLCTTVHLGANQATIETGHMLNPAGEEVATLTIANHGTEVRLSFETQTQASLVLHALLVHKDYRVVPTEGLQRVHRDLDSCQKVMWLAGCQPQVPNGFDSAYVTDAQARLVDIEGWIEAAGLPIAQHHEQCSVLKQVNVRYSSTTASIESEQALAYAVFADNGNCICFSTQSDHPTLVSLAKDGHEVLPLGRLNQPRERLATDGGRNPQYLGLFEGETYAQREARLCAVNHKEGQQP